MTALRSASPLLDRSRGNGEWALRIAIFFAGVLIALGAITYRHQWSAQPGFEEGNVAIHLLRGEGFASPFYLGRGTGPPSAYCAPVYPLIIAGCYYLAPEHGAILLLLVNCLCMGIIATSLYELGRFFISRAAGIWAAILLLVHPAFLFYAGDLWDAFVAMAIFMVIVCFAAHLPSIKRRVASAGALGVGMGVLLLTSPAYVLACPLIVSIAMRRCTMKMQIYGAASALAGAAIVLAPWTVRNWEVFHRAYFVRDELNFELREGNVWFATGWMGSELRDENLYSNAGQRAMVLSLGEPAYFDLCGEQFRSQYDRNPAAFWMRSLRRLAYIFISDPTQAQLGFPLLPDIRWRGIVIDRLLLHGFFAIGGISGAWLAWRRRLGCVWIFFAAVLAVVPFVFCTVDDRYVLPLRAVMIFFTAILLWELGRRLKTGDWPPETEG